ncbi:hypothetical protein GCM10007036_21560 [Alsobacter metallidurans]|uniref:Uncharacterized protein n=1 Tax=Alsobacter metallidurans TaxID=340221 RepID=A0A917I7Q4_9HYPH|nr:hypothetical protein [Alsobacter metallidurans]GGH18997.1 hypothetical protein GCM10007036_21560 [Alsobacter metallidurans]
MAWENVWKGKIADRDVTVDVEDGDRSLRVTAVSSEAPSENAKKAEPNLIEIFPASPDEAMEELLLDMQFDDEAAAEIMSKIPPGLWSEHANVQETPAVG